MPNIAVVLKEEIARLARKEIRAEMEALKRAAAKYRVEIAELKRKIGGLESALSRLSKNGKASGAGSVDSGSPDAKFRFRANGFQSHRKRLNLTRGEVAQLMDKSPATIANWESGTTRPRRDDMPKIAAFRKLSPRKARVALAQAGQQAA